MKPGINHVLSAIARPEAQPHTVFKALCELCDQTLGLKLCTFSMIDPVTAEGVRVFSNQPEAYPITGRKPHTENNWSNWVIDNHKTFVANDIDAIADVFFDYELIQSLGCESVINIPIVVGGKAIGTINCLNNAGHFTSERVIASEDLKLPGTACFLLAQSLQQRSA